MHWPRDGDFMIAQSRKRAVQMMFQITLNWTSRGSGIAWINAAHERTSFPLYDDMTGNIYSASPVVSSKSWTAGDVTGPDGYKQLRFDWVDPDGVEIDPDNAAALLTFQPLNPVGYIDVQLSGVRRELNQLPAGLKQTILDYPPTRGTFDCEIGFTNATAWMTLYGNNLPS